MKLKLSFPKLNQVVLLIIVADFLMVTGSGFVAPFWALFVTEQIIGGTPAVIGFAVAIYWITKSLAQLPVARYLDKNHGEIDDFYALVGGTVVISFLVFLYYFATQIWHLYLLQFSIAFADAAVVPPIFAIFTRHLDPDNVGFEWALRSSFSVGAGSAVSAAIGGVAIGVFGIRAMFLINAMLMFIAAVILLLLRPYIKPYVPTPVGRVFLEQKRV